MVITSDLPCLLKHLRPTTSLTLSAVAVPKGALTAFALWIPLIPLYFIMRNMANKQNGSDAGKKAKRGGAVDPSQRVTFADVAGVDEAKAELVELGAFF